MDKKKLFLSVFRKAERKYGANEKRLAGEGWAADWQTLVATIYSAQSRDETTIPVMENVFRKWDSLEKFANAPLEEIMKMTKRLNYYRTKSRNAKGCALMLLAEFDGKVPSEMNDLLRLPGVGRKTANLVLTEIHNGEGICVDTHVHRISNVLGLVKTKTPHETELELMKIAPRKYWSRINRLFVLWGKETPGRDKERLMKKLGED